MTSARNYPSQIYKLSGETPNAYVFVVQASTQGSPLLLSQLEAARNAATSVLEIAGATVESASSVLPIEPVPEGVAARLVLDPRVEFLDVGDSDSGDQEPEADADSA
ncbi:MAG: hypothetical protein ACOX0A_10640 [Thermoguttaceae bacterium]|jgi:hypothetical protein